MEALVIVAAIVGVVGLLFLVLGQGAGRRQRAAMHTQGPLWIAELEPRIPLQTRMRARKLVLQNKFIEAIKTVREDTGMSLKDAKRYVDALRFELDPGGARQRYGQTPSASAELVPPHVRDEALRLCHQGKKIQAVKNVREATNMGLKEAKDYVEALAEGRIPLETPVSFDKGSRMLSDRVRAFKAAEDYPAAIALVQAETGMSRAEAERFVTALD